MRRRLVTLTVLLAFLAIPQLAFATLIHNKDSQDHTVKLEQGSGSVSATVKAQRAVSFRCSSYPCKVKLGDSSITIKNSSEDVVIRNGKLAKQKRVANK